MFFIKKILSKFQRRKWIYQNRVFLKTLKSYGTNVSIRQPVCFEGPEFIETGNDVSIAAFVHIWGYGTVKIGNRVMIGSHTAISTISHDHSQENMFDTVVSKPIIIEDDVWIGAHVVIMPGVTIKKGAVIAAGAIVLNDVEPYQVVAGTPARVIKERSVNQGK